MSFKSKLSSLITFVFAVVAFVTVAPAQETPKSQDDSQKLERGDRRGGDRHRGMRGGKGRHGGMRGMRGLRALNLTDAQKEQIRTIHQANKPNEAQMAELKALRGTRKAGGEITDAQRQQLKEMRREMRTKHESVRGQILAILTPEQRTQWEAQKAEREKRREEFRENRKERKANRGAVKPTDDN